MKKNILILFMFLAVTTLKAQVGVNTENPQGIFHIDGQRDTSGNTNISDDVVVDTQGRVGVGTNSPQTKVDIRAASEGAGFRLQDGSQGNGKVLTTDGNGNGTWREPGVAYARLGNIPNNPTTNPVLDVTNSDTHIAYSGMNITLEPGDYQLNFTVWVTPAGDAVMGSTMNPRFASVFFSTSPTENIPPAYLTPIKSVLIPRLYNAGTLVPDYYGSGAIPIRITTETTLYLWYYVDERNWDGPDKRVTSYNQLIGSYGPYVQLFAVPFYIQ
ncbi:hypothetical protein [Dysgonomonas sp. 520]|uniref:hypothetical protein n=1 Tax=Dysgonomonas sp. 520 TaxID=2302931 RepID=UPI0013D174DC|nr:hypothetical protein [Dysgonomonas sp. 520]NDW09306.1 hypothetical protein [Dysgonomonas sp. 520]